MTLTSKDYCAFQTIFLLIPKTVNSATLLDCVSCNVTFVCITSVIGIYTTKHLCI